MNGLGIIKGLGVTLGHFFRAYLKKAHYNTAEGLQSRTSAKTDGVFTVQYPEEKLPTPEEFRFIPFLVYEEGSNGEKNYRCTSCGICAKVCPPQCIWIFRANDPVTGKPVPSPADFQIDIDICMNCGMCAEYCPFDAIKMDHDYEIASYERFEHHIYNIAKLGKPASYYSQIRPANYQKEMTAKAEKEAAKAASKKPEAAN